jgi:hypothetical protein
VGTKLEHFRARVSSAPSPKAGTSVSLRTTIILSVISTFFGATLSLFTSTLSTRLNTHKENTAERRTQLRALLELAYGLPFEATALQSRLWTTSEHGTSIENLANLRGQKFMDFTSGLRSDRVDRIQAIGFVHFPELDREINELSNAHYAAYSKAWQCSIDAVLERRKNVADEKITVKDFFPSLDCLLASQKLAEDVHTKVRLLVNASRTKLPVFVYEPKNIGKLD